MFDGQVRSSTVLREGGDSLPANVESETCATAAPAASHLVRREVLEGFYQVERHYLRGAHGAKG